MGALSTRSLASFRPRLVSDRTSLMTWIFFSPAPVRMTSNSSFSSSAGAVAAAAGGAPRHGHGRGRGHAELLLELLQQLGQLEDGHAGDGIEDFFFGCHCLCSFNRKRVRIGRQRVLRRGRFRLRRPAARRLARPRAPGRRLRPRPPARRRFRSGAAASATGSDVGSGSGSGSRAGGLGHGSGSGSGRGLGLRLWFGSGAAASASALARLGRGTSARRRRPPSPASVAGGGLGDRVARARRRRPGPRRPGLGGCDLLDQGLQAVGEVAGDGLEQTGELLQRGGQGAGQAGQHHLTGGQVGQGVGVLGGHHLGAEHPALHDQFRVRAGVVPQGLGHLGGVATSTDRRGSRRRWRSGRSRGLERQPEIVGGEADQGVLVDAVLAACGAQGPAQGGEVLHREAAVSVRMAAPARSKRSRTSVTTATFSGSGIVHLITSSSLSGRHANRPEEWVFAWSGGPVGPFCASARRMSMATMEIA